MVRRRRTVCPSPDVPLTPHDAGELARFAQWLQVEASRRAGADPAACDMLEAAIYPEGIGRPAGKGGPEA